MSDFLTSLAARTLGAMPVIAPRLASRFEASRRSGLAELQEEVTQRAAPPAATREERSSPANERKTAQTSVFAEKARPTAPEKNAPPAKENANVATTGAEVARSEKPVSDSPVARAGATSDFKAASTSREFASLSSLVQPQTRQARVAGRTDAAAERSAPAIHVTIGRVDVRAVHRPAPARPERKAPEAPRLTLGAYLRNQHG